MEYDDIPGTTRCTKLPNLGPIVEFHRFSTPMGIRFLSKVFKSNRTDGVSSSNHTVTNRSKSRTKNSCVLVHMHCTNHGQYRERVPGSSPRSVRLYLSLICLAQHCALLDKFHATLLSQSACCEISSSVHSLKTGRV